MLKKDPVPIYHVQKIPGPKLPKKEILMKKLIIFLIVFILIPNISCAEESFATLDTSTIIKKQEESFGIRDFLRDCERYAPDFINDLNIKNLFNNYVSGSFDNRGIFNKAGGLIKKGFTDVFKILLSIIVIVLIHSFLKALTDNLENNSVSQIVYYVQYILIVTIIMASFSEILDSIIASIDNMVGFTRSLVPLLITLMIYTGNITTSTVLEPILLFIIELIANIIKIGIIPIVSLIIALIIVSKISNRVQIQRISKFMKSSVVWTLGIILTVFIGLVSLEGSLTSAIDGVTAKTAKAAISSLIPVVGKVLGDGVDSVLGCGVILKNAVGVIGVIIIISICLLPIIKLAAFTIMYSVSSAIIEPLADEKIVKLLDEMSDVFKLLLAIICSVSSLLIIGITLVIKISNSGMMYR